MLTPTNDKVLKQALIYQAVKFTTLENANLLISDILETMERTGYHKGLPEHIECALNSGDGSYRP